MAHDERPRVSFVVTARNDNHGGELLRRLGIFARGLSEQCDRHGMFAELILVEWNPPDDKPRLSDAMTWPLGDRCSIRFIEVPSALHQRFPNSDRLPLFQMIAKNVGLRRARGDFIVATNVDVLFSDGLMQFLAAGDLRADRLYRVDRYDVSSNVPEQAHITAQLEFCRAHVIRINRRTHTEVLSQQETLPVVSPASTLPRAARLIPYWVKKRTFYRNIRSRAVSRRQLHTNASGDFTLLSRDIWTSIRGYPEMPVFSMHLDTVTCYSAFYAGASEHVLEDPARVYHLEHSHGWVAEAYSEPTSRGERLDPRFLPQVTLLQLEGWVAEMRRMGKPLIFNGDDWGLADKELSEQVLDAR